MVSRCDEPGKSKDQVIGLVIVAAGIGGGTGTSGPPVIVAAESLGKGPTSWLRNRVIESIYSLEALLLFPLELLITKEWKSIKLELQLLTSGSLDG